MSRSHVLHELQQTDLELEAVARRLAEIAASLGESEALRLTRQEAAAAEADLHACHGRAIDLDLEVGSLGERIKANEQKLYSGRVTSPKELSNLQDDIASLKRWRSKKEEEQLEAMLAEEAAQVRLAAAQTALTETTAAWQAGQVDLLTEEERQLEEQARLAARRTELAETAGAEDVALYERLRQRKGGRAVAVIRSGLCQACRMTPPSNQVQQASTGSELVFCNNCGRIMHVI
jgi:predicted  nucleic acid-binding Zn-ribbon protein